jgi:hypothetical protein
MITVLETLQTVSLEGRVHYKYTFFLWILAVILTLSTKEHYLSTFITGMLPPHVSPQFGATDIPEILVLMYHSKGRAPSQYKLKCYIYMCVPLCTGCF